MRSALPALGFGLLTSVMAFFGSPPPIVLSIVESPVANRSAVGAKVCGKRSARSWRRSIMSRFAAMPQICHQDGICSIEHYTRFRLAAGICFRTSEIITP
jgi:hypothetical protein